ncbi:MAG: trigger factor, partial [Gammaproteobacteria bacterium]|nr:trigger factor [Gammaproteobacteria bacterium]
MQVSVESSAGLERTIRVEVPADTIDQEVELRLKKVAKTAKIKGFRPGKVPAKVVRQQFGAEVRQDVLQEILQTSYSEALGQEELNPAGQPEINTESLDAGENLVYTATFEVYPEFEIQGLNALKVEQPTIELGDSDLNDMIDNLRKQRASWNAVERAAADGDQITVDFVGTLKGEAFEGGTGEDMPVVLGSGQMLEDFEKNLFGLKVGDTKEFKVKFPKDYPAEELAGEKAVFNVTAKKVEEQELAELTEEFIKGFGIESGSEEDLRSDVRDNMERESEAKAKAFMKSQLMEQIHDANKIDVPSAMVEQEITAMQKDAMQRAQITDESQAPARETFAEMAERRARLSLLMSEVISSEQIQVDDVRVTDKVDELCKSYPNAEEMRNLYLQNQQL